jgi:hypothetical protein
LPSAKSYTYSDIITPRSVACGRLRVPTADVISRHTTASGGRRPEWGRADRMPGQMIEVVKFRRRSNRSCRCSVRFHPPSHDAPAATATPPPKVPDQRTQRPWQPRDTGGALRHEDSRPFATSVRPVARSDPENRGCRGRALDARVRVLAEVPMRHLCATRTSNGRRTSRPINPPVGRHRTGHDGEVRSEPVSTAVWTRPSSTRSLVTVKSHRSPWTASGPLSPALRDRFSIDLCPDRTGRSDAVMRDSWLSAAMPRGRGRRSVGGGRCGGSRWTRDVVGGGRWAVRPRSTAGWTAGA